MAVEVKVLKVGSDILTDIRPGRVRRTLYAERSPALTPLAAFLIGITAGPLVLGAGKALLGGAARSEAKEKLESDLIEAKIAGEQAKVAEIRGKLALIAREFDPVSEEERTLKLQALRDSVPFDEQRRDITLERERANVAREDELFPTILRAREQAIEIVDSLKTERAERQVEFIQTERVRREAIAAEAELIREREAGLELQRSLVEQAIGPLDAAQAGQFLRERLFPKPAERPTPPRIFGATGAPFEFSPEGRITTIRAF